MKLTATVLVLSRLAAFCHALTEGDYGNGHGAPAKYHHKGDPHHHHHHKVDHHHHHKVDLHHHKIDHHHHKKPQHKNKKPQHKNKKPQHKNKKPQHKNKKPQHKNKKPQHKNKKPQHKNKKPQHKDKKPQHKDKKPQYKNSDSHKDNKNNNKEDDKNDFSSDFYRVFLGDNSNYFRNVLKGNPNRPGISPKSLQHGLSQKETNGKSKLGTLDAHYLPRYLGNNPLPNGKPWSKYDHHTNYYKKCPHTGVIRTYDFTISRGRLAPDGVEASVLLVNGAFPGPLIEANWGDTIQVTVHNKITGPEEGTALHWHGFLQTGTPWFDGVPGITHCPIAPGKSFTYQFHAELYGTTWYHSHYSSQYAGGIVGPMVIYGPEKHKYDVDVGPVMLSDWYHPDYFTLVKETMAPGGGAVSSDNNLINGKMNYNCTNAIGGAQFCKNDAPLAKFKFKKGKIHRLRLINSGAEGLQRFSIDQHKLTVIANDFVAVEPYETEVVTLGIGQRTDVLVKADGHLTSYWMRSNISHACSLSHQDFAVAAVYYDNAQSTNEVPRSKAWNVSDPATCSNDDLKKTEPVMKLKVPTPDLSLSIDLDRHTNASNIGLWRLAGQDFRINYNTPTLLLSNLGNTSFAPEWNAKDLGDAKSVRVIVNNLTPAPHPMHLHGFNMYILNEGSGTWDGTIVRSSNPQRRDVVQLQPNGHLAMQFDASENPGMWPFHCHIAWHASAGLFMQFLTQPDKVAKMKIPHTVAETCRQWSKWTKTNIPDQIDSGL
ncbi:multicopper oxidase domain-containing protein [Hirsutella rhossiliensis]|uniref:Multicopper oxidase domain-containing protein n=1 Tax=Hirsutella rhossiliensis TaxID=111463 RepID=A0A9P8MXZ3_9HYPO|nr:multicopper oxidase domain-containing protein [Hirsutella rhossiliensis]KAH0963392.1 multicopper oxidase domain-containing protein [Hirsutella rhossiliensis]